MKKVFALLLALAMMFSLAACGGGGDDDKTPASNNPQSSQQQEDKTPEADPAPDETEETPAPEISEATEDVIEDWTDCFSLPGLTTPEGFVVTNQKTRNTSTSDNVRLGTAHFEKEGGFTEDEITAFAQMIWDACMEISPDGIYQVEYVDGKPAAGTPYADLSAAHNVGKYYGWDYTHDGVYITIQVDYGSFGDGVLRLGCSEHR